MIPSDSADKFSATPFVSGALTGRRTFRIVRLPNDEIKMYGPVYDGEWTTAGVNTAVCLAHDTKGPWHRVASKGCQCGWWAYFSETPEVINYRGTYRGGLCVEGIIFGFGLCGAGERGFRCAKARIKALVIPSVFALQTGLDIAAQERLLFDAMAKYRDNGDFRWYENYATAAADWPLSSAQKYGLLPPPDDGKAA